MELDVKEKTKNRIVMDVKGGGHTFCNILKKELWKDDRVKNTAYNVDHPLVGNPELVVQVKRGNEVTDSLVDAVDRIHDMNEEFLEEFQDAM